MRYRRTDVAGGTYFFTVNLAERKRTLLVDHVDVLRAVMQKVKTTLSVRIDAIAILPDHRLRSGRCPLAMQLRNALGVDHQK